MKADLIIHNINTVYTPYIVPPIRGKNMSKLYSLDHAFIAIQGDRILAVSTGSYEQHVAKTTVLHDAKGAIAIPGLIDSHTHLVHAGSRENEYNKIKSGVPYLDILKAGGGILTTVEATRHATFTALYTKAYHSLDEMMLHGVTVVEAKSGYGLNLETETKQMSVAKELDKDHPIKVISTYMGAHAIPKEYTHFKDDYVDEVIEDLKVIKKKRLAEAADVFCEEGVFTAEDAKHILMSAHAMGFKVKLHADEIKSIGGTSVGIELGASSVDHLMNITDSDIMKLAKTDVAANLLPGTSFYLKKKYAPARKIIDAGCIVSISSDYNPGSCPTENFQLIMQLASQNYEMKPEEILNATTLNAAYHLGIHESYGSLEPGKIANIVLLNVPNLSYMLYHYGINHTKDVFIHGKPVVVNRQIVRKK